MTKYWQRLEGLRALNDNAPSHQEAVRALLDHTDVLKDLYHLAKEVMASRPKPIAPENHDYILGIRIHGKDGKDGQLNLRDPFLDLYTTPIQKITAAAHIYATARDGAQEMGVNQIKAMHAIKSARATLIEALQHTLHDAAASERAVRQFEHSINEERAR